MAELLEAISEIEDSDVIRENCLYLETESKKKENKIAQAYIGDLMEDFKKIRDRESLSDMELRIPTFIETEHFLQRGKELIDGEPIQASEKLYKTAENCIKILSQKYAQKELDKAKEAGQWWTKLLNRASSKIGKNLSNKIPDGDRIPNYWDAARLIHIDGFHEGRLSPEELRKDNRLGYVEKLLEIAESEF